MQLHAQRLQGGDEVDGERVSLLPEADQQTDSDPSQHSRLSDRLIDQRPVSVGASRTTACQCGTSPGLDGDTH